MNIRWASSMPTGPRAEQRDAARVFTDYVLTPDVQKLIMDNGFRPANPDVELGFPFVAENGVDRAGPPTVLDVPAPEVIAAIQQSWSFVKKQADILLLIDVSGSMDSESKLGSGQSRRRSLHPEHGADQPRRAGHFQ